MLFLDFSTPDVSSSGHCATCAAIRSLLAYAQGLEGCRIDVEVSQGIVMLTGHASCDAAVDKAIEIAADFSSKPVHSTIDVQETCLPLPSPPACESLKDGQASGKILYMKRDMI